VKILFSKYHGAGNDFILIDNRVNAYALNDPGLIRRLCDRHTGIGADGVLIVQMSDIADYKMRIFNADASEPAMCGNGIRCVFDFLTKSQAAQQLQIEIAGRVLSCKKIEEHIGVNLGSPRISHWPIILELENGPMSVYVLDTGVLHAVVFIENILRIPFLHLAQKVRWDPAFAPSGANVNFVHIGSDGSILLRTYERGVECETLSCGTGAAAAAWAAAQVHALQGAIAVSTRTDFQSDRFQHTMRFSFPIDSHGQKQIEMIGPADCVFTGWIDVL
jgi:diaminopimelate epimerase